MSGYALLSNVEPPPPVFSSTPSEDSYNDIVQFYEAITYVNEGDQAFQIDVMRIGALKGEVSVHYHTADDTARAGDRYISTRGKVTFQDGEYCKSFGVRVPYNSRWAPMQQFKVVLSDPRNCRLGRYLHDSQVRIMSTNFFPSSRFSREIEMGEEGIWQINSMSLFLEYWKLIFRERGMAWSTVIIIVLDQLKNLYSIWTFWVGIYFIDVVFNVTDPTTEEKLFVKHGRLKTAYLLAVSYVLPHFVMNAWEVYKSQLDIHGFIDASMQRHSFWQYLNIDERSRSFVGQPMLQHILTHDSRDIAEGYTASVNLCRLIGKLILLTVFAGQVNPDSLTIIAAMPVIMLIFGGLRHKLVSGFSATFLAHNSAVLDLVVETCNKYRLIADYHQRPRVNRIFQQQSEDLREAMKPMTTIKANNNYFPEWLGAFSVMTYIFRKASLVLSKQIPLGVFMTTIGIIMDLSVEFVEVYKDMLVINHSTEALRTMTKYFNLPSEALEERRQFLQNKEQTAKAMNALMEKEVKDNPNSLDSKFRERLSRYDHLPIKVKDLVFKYHGRDESVFQGLNQKIPQGCLVWICGGHGTGKSTLVKLLAASIFPQQGYIFVPSHLRILHVTQEHILFKASAWYNLTYGCLHAADLDVERIRKILLELDMPNALKSVDHYLQEAYDGDGADKDGLSARAAPDEEKPPHTKHNWHDMLSYSEKVKLNLARALVTNPEVLVLQRPLYHYDADTAKFMFGVLRQHVMNCGFQMPSWSVRDRRPRTCFFSTEEAYGWLQEAFGKEKDKCSMYKWDLDEHQKSRAEKRRELQKSKDISSRATLDYQLEMYKLRIESEEEMINNHRSMIRQAHDRNRQKGQASSSEESSGSGQVRNVFGE